MSWGMGNVGGGSGLGSAFAVIAVTYPAGSTCTCTKGTRTLRAKDTSGAYLFAIPEAGTWTVSCTDGTEAASVNVVINSQYQVEKAFLQYELVLFDGSSGGDNTSITGGWEKLRGTLNVTETEIRFASGESASRSSAYTKNAIPLYGYSRIDFTGYTESASPGSACQYLIATSKTNDTSGTIATINSPHFTSGTVSIDLSGLNLSPSISYYIGLSNNSRNSPTFLTKCIVV